MIRALHSRDSDSELCRMKRPSEMVGLLFLLSHCLHYLVYHEATDTLQIAILPMIAFVRISLISTNPLAQSLLSVGNGLIGVLLCAS